MAQMASGAWKLKNFTVDAAIANCAELKALLDVQLPAGYTTAFVLNDNQDWTTYVDKQLIYVVALKGALYTWTRYNATNTTNTTTNSSFSTRYDIIANVGDKITIIYQ